ncbi:PaaI family thioesterase [Halorientalis litorea]|jgi:uncharacterized protein (TIGR00369 family)|uniref:PaaI family thioesterase n=1 Tax=Halorientalis litorea TaxID=2931977 RepID=UPI001FF36DEF|nr:PaaI family thioesterase [Halorientalis litorea]
MAKDLPEGAPVMLRMSVEREKGYLSRLDVHMEDLQYGGATLVIPFDESLTDDERDPPTVHNGIAATLLEQAAELAIRTTMPDPVNDTVEPLSLDINFLYDAVYDLTATAEVVDTHDTSAVASVTVESKTPEGNVEPMATGQGVFRAETD